MDMFRILSAKIPKVEPDLVFRGMGLVSRKHK